MKLVYFVFKWSIYCSKLNETVCSIVKLYFVKNLESIYLFLKNTLRFILITIQTALFVVHRKFIFINRFSTFENCSKYFSKT